MLSALQLSAVLVCRSLNNIFFNTSGVLTCMWLFLLEFTHLLHAAVSLYIHSENESAMFCNFVIIAIFPSKGFSGGSQSSVSKGEFNS